MRPLVLVLIISVFWGCSSEKKNPAQNDPEELLGLVFDHVKKESIYSNEVDWVILEKQMDSLFSVGSQDSLTSLIRPFEHMLSVLGEFHGWIVLDSIIDPENLHSIRFIKANDSLFYKLPYHSDEYWQNWNNIEQFMLQLDSIRHMMLQQSIAYVEIPLSYIDPNDTISKTKQINAIRSALCNLQSKNPKGWIIDLRSNLGGSMWPMMNGLGALFPNIDLGGVTKDGHSFDQRWKMVDGIFHYGEDVFEHGIQLSCPDTTKNVKYIFLVGRYTASSGESLVSAFKGQQNMIILGEETSGFTTSNDGEVIGGRVICNIGTSYFMSNNGESYKSGGIKPDIKIESIYDPNNPIKGPIIDTAIDIINAGFINEF